MGNKLFLLMNSDFTSLDKSLQEEVYREFFNLVYGVSMYIIQDHSAAEDIVQEAFLKTIYNAPSFETEHQLRAWIKVVTKNLTFNVLRKNKKIRNHDDIESVINNDLNIHNESIEKEVEVKMLEKNITDSLSEINPDYRKLIELKWKSGKSNKDISQDLNLTESAIKQKLHRARKALKKRVQKWGFQDE
jgi:RNA polymerase sigma-70 factor (ECF subfamily)